MSGNKIIDRKDQKAASIFNQRSLEKDYRTLLPLIKPGMRVLDIGCGTGAITKDIAAKVGESGFVIGIDHTKQFIDLGNELFGNVRNLQLLNSDALSYTAPYPFDLIVSARTFQWLSTVDELIVKIKNWLKPSGMLSILDYDHTQIEWEPEIPASMRYFYQTFLKWRADAGMQNDIGKILPSRLMDHGFTSIQSIRSDEHYQSSDKEKLAIWSKVAQSTQMLDEGYLTDAARLEAISDYTHWINQDARSMTMKLWDTQAILCPNNG